MAKKHPEVPALRAVDVWRWINAGKLQTYGIRNTPVIYLACGKTVRQTWIDRNRRGEILRPNPSRTIYLCKGAFLIPIWLAVSKWEIEHLKSQGIDLRSRGIRLFDRGHLRLCYMQVEDLDHAMRQQVYVLDGYLGKEYPSGQDFEELFEQLAHAEAISRKVSLRKIGLDATFDYLQINLAYLRRDLHRWHQNLQSILDHAPAFKQETTLRERQPVITTLRRMAERCRGLTMRPVGVRLGRAARSLELAAEHIQNGCLDLARARIRSALKNLEYPKPEIEPSTQTTTPP